MASSMDFKDLFERYQRVGAKNGISIVNYCKINGLRRVKYIADVLRKLISGETDYIALLPMNIINNLIINQKYNSIWVTIPSKVL